MSGHQQRQTVLTRRQRLDLRDGEQRRSGKLSAASPLAGARVRLTQSNAADQPLQVVTVSDKVARQPVEQLRMRGGIRRVHLIERIDQATAEQSGPDPV